MNKKYIQYNLEEIQEELENIIRKLKSSKDYAPEEFYQSMQHLFHHANTAWNTRNLAPQETENASEADQERWGKYPTDMILI